MRSDRGLSRDLQRVTEGTSDPLPSVRSAKTHVRRAPSVTENQAGCLRFTRDNGSVKPEQYNVSVLNSCRHHRWLAPRTEGYVLTDAGRAALAHCDADVTMEKLWKGARG